MCGSAVDVLRTISNVQKPCRKLIQRRGPERRRMARLPLFDAHCHLQDLRLANRAPQLIQQASDAGVRWFAVNGTSETGRVRVGSHLSALMNGIPILRANDFSSIKTEDWGVVKKMGENYNSVIPNFGLHPWWIPKRSDKWLSSLREMLEANPTAAVGEVGLDLGTRGREISEALQVEILREQLNLGRDLQRPVSVHCVRAIGPLQSLLSKMGTFPAGVIMHSFNGPAEAVKGLVKNGAYFSFSGFLTPIKPSKAKKVLEQVPLDRILLETDAPDALPEVDLRSLVWIPEDPSAPSPGHENEHGNQSCCSEGTHTDAQEKKRSSARGALNHPANIQANLSYVASLMGVSEEVLAAQTFENAQRIFSFSGSKLLQ